MEKEQDAHFSDHRVQRGTEHCDSLHCVWRMLAQLCLENTSAACMEEHVQCLTFHTYKMCRVEESLATPLKDLDFVLGHFRFE